MAKIISTNPSKNYEVIGEVEISTDKEIRQAVEKANKAKKSWKDLGVEKRIELLRPILEEFRKREDELARLITQEMGKPITKSYEEVRWTFEEFQWYLDNAEQAVAEEVTYEDENSLHKIVYEPIGTVALITPWNFPFGMLTWGIVPSLLVGNTVVFKISEETPLMGKLVEGVFKESNLPEGVFSEVYGGGDVGEKLVKEEIDFINFTGSTNVGKKLYKIAAEKFIGVLLEMGGSSPAIVFDDADPKTAAETVSNYRFQNCGQACDAIKRAIVHESIFDEFVNELR